MRGMCGLIDAWLIGWSVGWLVAELVSGNIASKE
jgi:hypothetical protein